MLTPYEAFTFTPGLSVQRALKDEQETADQPGESELKTPTRAKNKNINKSKNIRINNDEDETILKGNLFVAKVTFSDHSPFYLSAQLLL